MTPVASRRKLGPVLALVALAVPVAAMGQSPTPMFEDVIGLRSVGSVAISPDGRNVAYTVRTTEWKENRFDTEIWLAREGSEPLQLTRTDKGSSTSPRWSPDGRWLAFLADRGGKQQVYVLSPDGGEAMKATAAAEGVSSFRWSPDGAWLAYTAVEPPSDSVKARRERYGEFAVEDAEYVMTHLWVVAAEPAGWQEGRIPDARRLTGGNGFTVGAFDWSPDGASLAFDHRRDPLINSGPTGDISLVRVEGGAITALVTAPGSDAGPQWSPDGQWVLYTSGGPDTTTNYFRNNLVFRVAATGGAPVRLGEGFDEQINGLTWTVRGIYFTAWERTRRHLYLLDPASGSVRRAADTPLTIVGYDVTPDGETVAILGLSADSLAEIYRTPVDPFAPVRLTAMNEQIAGWPIGTAEIVSWRARDGVTIEGVLHKPRDFDPRRRYPLLVVIHGGPTGIDIPQPFPGSVYPVAQWVSKGALVLRPNYRGSAGYGERFRSLNVRNLGVGDMWDVMSGVEHLARQGVVDTARMGAMGWSQGGYISAFLTTNTTRFKAISVGAGISNWVTYYVATDIHPFTRQYLRATPWDDPEIYRKTSPMMAIRQARTPTLIQHGEFDRRVPIQNAYELFQGLQDRGVETRLIVYKGFGHSVNKPKEQLAALWHNWQWFGRHLWGELLDPEG